MKTSVIIILIAVGIPSVGFGQQFSEVIEDVDTLISIERGKQDSLSAINFYTIARKYTLNSSKMTNKELYDLLLQNPLLKNLTLQLAYKNKFIILENKYDNQNIIANAANSIMEKKEYTSFSANIDQEIITAVTNIIEKRVEQEMLMVAIKHFKELIESNYSMYLPNMINYLSLVDSNTGIPYSLSMLRSAAEKDLYAIPSKIDQMFPKMMDSARFSKIVVSKNQIKNASLVVNNLLEKRTIFYTLDELKNKLNEQNGIINNAISQLLLLSKNKDAVGIQNDILNVIKETDTDRKRYLHGILFQLCIQSKAESNESLSVGEYCTQISEHERNIYLQRYRANIEDMLYRMDEILKTINDIKVHRELYKSEYQYMLFAKISELYFILCEKPYFVQPRIINENVLSRQIFQHIGIMYANALDHQYSMMLTECMSLITSVGNENGRSGKMKIFANNGEFIKILAILASIAEAKSTEEIEAAISNTMLPPGSYRIKRGMETDLAINAYGGFTIASEASSRTRPALGIGVTAPIGISYSWTCEHHHSYSFFFSAFDFGLPLYARIASRDTNEWKYNVRLVDLIAPGISFLYNYQGLPFSAGFTISYLPNLRSIPNGVSLSKYEMYRIGIQCLVDIPMYSIYTSAK